MTSRKATLLIAATFLGLLCASCGSDEEDDLCEGPEVLPHLSPVALGELYPLGSEEENIATNERTPYEWVLLLQSQCAQDVTFETACFVGDPDKNGDDVAQFELEGPVPGSATLSTDAAVRITYKRSSVASDDDGDGRPDADNVALVLQSNAANFPTLIVPVCARLLEEGGERQALTCASPIAVEAGTTQADLCAGQ